MAADHADVDARILSTGMIRQVERDHAAQTPSLMSLAGLAVAARAKAHCPDLSSPILIAVGPGNNGGDAIVAAAHLSDWGYRPTVLMNRSVDAMPDEVAAAYERWRRADNECLTDFPEGRSFALVVDGLFGIGLDRPIEGVYAQWIDAVNAMRAAAKTTVLAIDVPSGLNADTGETTGVCMVAAETLTFLAHKPGLLTADGPDYAGTVIVDPIGVEFTTMPEGAGRVNAPERFQGLLAPRKQNSHKGCYGALGLIGGSDGMVGAILLAARAALKFGAGRVIVGTLARQSVPVDMRHPELMIRSPQRLIELVSDAAIESFDALVLGPGMGDHVYTGTPILRNALLHDIALVLDADALNQIAVDRFLQKMLEERDAASILTPHPGEAARLLDASTRWVQSNRVASAQELARQFHAFVALKGAGTVIAAPDGRWLINRSGNPGMASGGMGDALSGMVGALLAQRLEPFDALAMAVYLHGAAADACVDAGIGPVGLTASEVADAARALLNRLS